MRLKQLALFLALFVAGVFLATACGSNPEAVEAMAREVQNFGTLLSTTIQDGIVTPEETQVLVAGFEKLGGSIVAAVQPSGTDWTQSAVEVGIAVVLAFFGVRVAPNRFILGTKPDADVARVAAASTKE